jgi:hypothetical protein
MWAGDAAAQDSPFVPVAQTAPLTKQQHAADKATMNCLFSFGIRCLCATEPDCDLSNTREVAVEWLTVVQNNDMNYEDHLTPCHPFFQQQHTPPGHLPSS